MYPVLQHHNHRRSRMMYAQTGHKNDSSFIIRTLYKDSYWLQNVYSMYRKTSDKRPRRLPEHWP